MARDVEDGFLSRWSRRKQAIASGEVVPDTAPGHEVEEAPAGEVSEERLAELAANKEAAEAIDLETLTYDSDFSAFFKDGVPLLLKQQAMRMLWRSNPLLANVDGLCDYDDNFADPSLILEKFESAYRIGKGYLFEDEEEGEEDHAIASDEEIDETDTIAEESVADAETEVDVAENEDGSTADVLEDEAMENVEEAPVDIALNDMPEQMEQPRVSLRQRLQLDA